MKVYGDFNNISDELKAKIVPLKPGDWVDYQMLPKFRVTVNYPMALGGKTEHWYPHKMFWARDSIWDTGKQAPVNIGVVAPGGVDPKTGLVTIVESFEFERSPAGTIRLSGDNIMHRELHEFLQLTNLSENSVLGPDRDASIDPEFKLMDYKKERKAKTEKRKVKAEAMQYAELMDAAEIREFAAGMGWNPKLDMETLTDMVGEYAETEPADFTSKAVDPLMKVKAVAKLAMEAGKISFDPANYKILWANGQTLATLERREGKTELDAFADWIQTSTNGPKVLEQLRKKSPVKETA